DQWSADATLPELAVDRKPCGLQSLTDRICCLVCAFRQRVDALQLLTFDRAQRLVNGCEKAIGAVGACFLLKRGDARRRRSGLRSRSAEGQGQHGCSVSAAQASADFRL